MQTDKQTDGHGEATSRFLNLANITKQGKSHQRMKKIIMKIKLEEERTVERTEGFQYHLSASRS